jgi:pSer/pThr/pTyr-binding forkhead associated (FHA) protein
MTLASEIGLVCGRCGRFAPGGREEPEGTPSCGACGHDLAWVGQAEAGEMAEASETRSNSGLPGESSKGAHGASPHGYASGLPPPEKPMDQAKYFVCQSCMTPVPSGHKFCGRCGAGVPEDALNLRTDFFSDMQDPEKARLVLIRGDGMEGLSYHLKADQHLVGRQGQLEFPDDLFVSPRHANFFYRDGRLVVRDEGSLNGVYIRIRGSVEITAGDTFLAGEQLFRVDPTPKASDGIDAEGTYFYSSPKYPAAYRVNQILEGGAIGMTICARSSLLAIGREDGDLNFPGDIYMSAKHCTIEEREGHFFLTDLGSRNGTYVRLKTDRELSHGDYVFIGRKLLRVELNAN